MGENTITWFAVSDDCKVPVVGENLLMVFFVNSHEVSVGRFPGFGIHVSLGG